MKKLFATVMALSLFSSNVLPILQVSGRYEGIPATTFRQADANYYTPEGGSNTPSIYSNGKDEINLDFENYQKCIDQASENLKYKTYNIANGIGAIGKANLYDFDKLGELVDKGTITQEEMDYLQQCYWGSNESSRFLNVVYPTTGPKNPNGTPQNIHINVNKAKTILVKDFYVEGGLYKLGYGGENYSFLNSFYLFNGLGGKNKIDFWVKSLISHDDSFGHLQPSEKFSSMDFFRKRLGLLKWLHEHNQENTKFLGYSFLSKNPLTTKNALNSKDFNEKLKSYFNNATNKNQFIQTMNTKSLGEQYLFNADGIEVIAVGMQLNPYWNMTYKRTQNKAEFSNSYYGNTWGRSDCLYYSNYKFCKEFSNNLINSYSTLTAISFADGDFIDGGKFNQYNKGLHKGSRYFSELMGEGGYYKIINNDNSPQSYTFNNLNISRYNTDQIYTKIREKNISNNNKLGLTKSMLGLSLGMSGIFDNPRYWRGYYGDTTFLFSYYPKYVFSFYDDINYLINAQYLGEQAKGTINNEDFFFKNGTSKATLELDQGVYLTTIVGLPSIINGFDKISEEKYNYNWGINYGLAFSPKDSNASVPMLLMDAFRGKFNPKIYDYFNKTVFRNPLNPATAQQQGSLNSISQFLQDFKSKASLYQNDESDEELVVNGEDTYNVEKNKKPLDVIRENNLYGHYRTIKDYDSSVPKPMQILGNIKTQYITSTLANSVIAMENLGEDYNAYKNTFKDYKYNIIDKNLNNCDDYKDQGCLSSYWETISKNPQNLITFSGDKKGIVPKKVVHSYIGYAENSYYSTYTNSAHLLFGGKLFRSPDFKVHSNGETYTYEDTYLNNDFTNKKSDYPKLTSNMFNKTSGSDGNISQYFDSTILREQMRKEGFTIGDNNKFKTSQDVLNFINSPKSILIYDTLFSAGKNTKNIGKGDFHLSSEVGSTRFLDYFLVGNGAKLGHSEMITIQDSKQRLMGAIGDYKVENTPNGRKVLSGDGTNVFGIVPNRYVKDFESTKGNLTYKKDGKTIHTLPFGTYLLDKKPYVDIGNKQKDVILLANTLQEPNAYIDSRRGLSSDSMQSSMNFYNNSIIVDEKRDFSNLFKPYYNSNNQEHKYLYTNLFDRAKISKDYGNRHPEYYNLDRFSADDAFPLGKSPMIWRRITYPSTLSNDRKIEENNSYGVYYLNNSNNRQKYISIVADVEHKKPQLFIGTSDMAARGYTFGLNSPILPMSIEEEDAQTFTPYLHLEDKEYSAQIGKLELQLATRETKPVSEATLSMEQRMYKKPALLISFNKDGLVSQRNQSWVSNDIQNKEMMRKINDIPYIQNSGTFQTDVNGKMAIENSQIETLRTFFPLKDKWFEGFFSGDNKLPVQIKTNANENAKINQRALVNALVLNLINNNANLSFQLLKKVNGKIEPKIYHLYDSDKEKAYYFLVVEDNQSVTLQERGMWAVPITIDKKEGRIEIYNKIKVLSTLKRFKETFEKATPNALGNDYYFEYSASTDIGGAVVEGSNVYELPTTQIAIKEIRNLFLRSQKIYEDDIGVSVIENKNPLENKAVAKTPHTISSLLFRNNEDVSLKEIKEETMLDFTNLGKFDEIFMNPYLGDGEKPTPYAPEIDAYVNKTGFLGGTQYVVGLNKSLSTPDRVALIREAEQGNETDAYKNKNIEDWEKEAKDNSINNFWMYKMNFQEEKFITIFNMLNYTNASVNAPDKQLIGQITGEGGNLFSSVDDGFKLDNTTLNILSKFIPNQDILSRDSYDVSYKIDPSPIRLQNNLNAGSWSKGRINIISNFNQTKGITIGFKGNNDLLNVMKTEFKCGSEPTQAINFKNNFGVWKSNKSYQLYQAKNAQDCYLEFAIKVPSNPDEALLISGQSFEFNINLNTNPNPSGIGEKKHEFQLKGFNISESSQVSNIEDIPQCRIVAKTKTTTGSTSNVAGSRIEEATSSIELDVWYKNPELHSVNNYQTTKALLGTDIELELTGNAKFQNFNAEYYTSLTNKSALDYLSSLPKSEFTQKVLGLIKNGISYTPKKVKVFIGGSHFKKNRFYGKTTFTVIPVDGNLNNFAFSVKGSCEFQYLNDKKKLNSDTIVSFTYPKQAGQNDTATMSYYNPLDKENGTLFSTGYSKIHTTENGKTLNLMVKQYYPSILSVSYNHIAPAKGIDSSSKVLGVENGINGSDVLSGDKSNWGAGCMQAERKVNMPNHGINGTAKDCLASGGLGGSALNYTINHPAKGGSGWGHGILNITSGEGQNDGGTSPYKVDETSRHGNRSGRTKHNCFHWTRNAVDSLNCGNGTYYSTKFNITNNGVNSGEKLGQGFGGYYYLGVDGSFDIDKKIVGKEGDGNSKVFFDKIIPLCMNSSTTNGRYKTLTLSEKNAVIMIDNGGELNGAFKNSINGRVCTLPSSAIEIIPIVENNVYKYKNKPFEASTVIDKFTGLPFFMTSSQKGKIPTFNGAGGNTSVSSTIDKNKMLKLYLHEELIKEIRNNPDNIKVEFRFVDANQKVDYGDTNIPGGSSFIKLGGNQVGTVGIDTLKSGKVRVMFRVGFKLKIDDVKGPSEIKNNKLYKLLDEGIKDSKKEKIFEMQLPIVTMSSFSESYGNGSSTVNELFLTKNGNTNDGLKSSLSDNFSIKMNYKKYAASSYRTGHNTMRTYYQRFRRCSRRSCYDRERGGFLGGTNHYNSQSQSNDYIRGFNSRLTDINASVKDNIITTFYPYTDNTGDQINNKTVLINGIPSIKNIDKNQLVYQGVCNVCNQYRGNIFEQHPIGVFNPEHREKGSQQNIFDYYSDSRNFNVVNTHLSEKKEVVNISGDVTGKALANRYKGPFVSRISLEDEVKVVEILPTSVEDKVDSALKYYGQKALLVGKKQDKGTPATLLISGDIVPSDYDNLVKKKKIESELVIVSEGDIVIGSDVNIVNAILITKGNLIIMPGNTSFKLHGGAIINGKIMNYRTNITDIKPSDYSENYKTYLKNLDLFDMKYPVLFTLDTRYATSKIFTFIGSVSKTTAK